MHVEQLKAGPGQHRSWNPISEFEVGRPKLRARKNPVPQNWGNNPGFPMPGTPMENAALQLLAWNLRDGDVILPGKTWNQPRSLFTQGLGSPFTPFGGTTAVPKPQIQTNINSATGLLPSPQSFLLSHLRTIVRGDIFQPDFLNLLYSTYYQFQACDVNLQYFEGPGAVLPSGSTGIFAAGASATAPGTTYASGWPVAHNVASIRTGLIDPSIGSEDMGYNISENKQFKFILDPTQQSFIAGVLAQGSWATTATGASGTGVQVWVELCGVLSRSTAG